LPSWSPVGQFINADSLDIHTLYLFDVKAQRWSTLYVDSTFAYAIMSKDGRSHYFLRIPPPQRSSEFRDWRGNEGGCRIKRISPIPNPLKVWLWLDPTDAPLMLRDVSTSDIYTLTLGN
jgi:hypothetical protein